MALKSKRNYKATLDSGHFLMFSPQNHLDPRYVVKHVNIKMLFGLFSIKYRDELKKRAGQSNLCPFGLSFQSNQKHASVLLMPRIRISKNVYPTHGNSLKRKWYLMKILIGLWFNQHDVRTTVAPTVLCHLLDEGANVIPVQLKKDDVFALKRLGLKFV
jgi:hypothetical protein